MDEKVPSGGTVEDAQTLAQYEGFGKGSHGFTDYVKGAVVQAATGEHGLNGAIS